MKVSTHHPTKPTHFHDHHDGCNKNTLHTPTSSLCYTYVRCNHEKVSTTRHHLEASRSSHMDDSRDGATEWPSVKKFSCEGRKFIDVAIKIRLSLSGLLTMVGNNPPLFVPLRKNPSPHC
ncbi:hypothetical protein V6N13_042651 [Hibiscus sabdariffa]